jgi:hypothetical protein
MIHRLNYALINKLTQGQSEEIQVIYLDVLGHQMKPVRQQYTRLSDTMYRYQNVPNDFEANIQVDEFGFVMDYQSLFVRIAALKTNFSS